MLGHAAVLLAREQLDQLRPAALPPVVGVGDRATVRERQRIGQQAERPGLGLVVVDEVGRGGIVAVDARPQGLERHCYDHLQD
jgi:hypothetical protein